MDTCEPELSPRERAQVAATWLERARAEELAVIRFKRLSGELRACGTHPTVLAMVEKAIVHEGEHAQLCLGLARGYGARHVHTSESEQAGPLAPASMGRSDALLFEMVAYCCLTESLNAALLLEIAQRASQGEIVRAAQKILKDEVQHSQMGWAHLTWCRAQGLGDFLPEVLPTMFNQTGAEAFASSQPPPSRARLFWPTASSPLTIERPSSTASSVRCFYPGSRTQASSLSPATLGWTRTSLSEARPSPPRFNARRRRADLHRGARAPLS